MSGPDVMAVIDHDGDRWSVLSKGSAREDGFVYCHLASNTRAVRQRNGSRPVQIADWIDPRKLARFRGGAE